MLSVGFFNNVMLTVVMLIVLLKYYAVCRYAECRGATHALAAYPLDFVG